jgi:hypothetical protein
MLSDVRAISRPDRSVTNPPASRTSAIPAAMSQGARPVPGSHRRGHGSRQIERSSAKSPASHSFLHGRVLVPEAPHRRLG